jgi:anti-sigma factor RsiW
MTVTDRVRWTDDRLDDAFARVNRRLETVEDVSVRLTRVEGQVKGVHEDTQEIKEAMAVRARDREAERQERERERRSNIRWLIGTALSSAAIIVAAVGVLQGFVG